MTISCWIKAEAISNPLTIELDLSSLKGFSIFGNKSSFEAIFTPTNLCGDNAERIALVGLEKYKLSEFSELDHSAKPRWALDENAAFLKGAGVKL